MPILSNQLILKKSSSLKLYATRLRRELIAEPAANWVRIWRNHAAILQYLSLPKISFQKNIKLRSTLLSGRDLGVI